MEYLEKMIEMADNEFGAIAKNGKFKSREEIHSAYELMDIAKDAMYIMKCEEEMDGGDYYSEDGDMSYARGGRGGRSYRGSYDGGYDGGSYARGRRNARRDSMGRYSRDGYSREHEDYVEQLRNMMQTAPDDQTRQSIQRMIQTMEQG